MTLATGTHLGSYEVVVPIGAGGMGEVYQAHDTKLGRDVAIKVLPELLHMIPKGFPVFSAKRRYWLRGNSNRVEAFALSSTAKDNHSRGFRRSK